MRGGAGQGTGDGGATRPDCADVDVANVNPDLAIEAPRQGKERVVNRANDSDFGPCGGGGASSDDARDKKNASAAGAA